MYKTFRPKTNFVWAGIAFVLILLFAANSFVVVNNPLQTLFELVLCGIFSGVVYLIWIRPKLVFGAEELEVVNPLSTETIAYRDIQDLDTKWALTIIHAHGKTRVWVAPASGKRRWIADQTFGWRGRGVPMSEAKTGGIETMSGSLHSLSGQAAYLIREHIKRLH